ncbi:MAG: hypothetical protein OEU95_09980, partial [Nitrospirota bacterium]|nr:hypothetical protein [Nitrospirota bacterium]
MSEIVVRKSPINFVDKEVVPYCPGESVEDIRKRLPAEVEFTVSIDGRIIPPEKLSYIYPQPGQVIVFTPYAGDGDILRIVAFIAVAVFAPYVAAGLMNVIGGGTFAAGLAGGISAFGMAGTLMTAGVMIGGGMLVNALMPASVPELPSYDSPRNSQMYSWGAQTTQKQGTAIPYNYGMHKLKGNIINWYTSTYSTADGEKNAINVLICLGIGPYESLSDFRLNGQPLANLPEVTVWTNLGHLDQDPLPGFSDTKIEYPQGIKITQASGGYTYTTIGDDFDKIELELTWPALYFLNDDGRYNSARVEYRIEMSETGAGQWQALTYQPFDKKEGARAGNWSAGYRINATGRTYTFSDGSSCQDRDIWVERYDNNYYQGHRGMTTATEGCRWYGITTRYNGHEVYWHELTSSDVVVSSESSINWEEVQGARDTPRKKTYTFTMPKLG